MFDVPELKYPYEASQRMGKSIPEYNSVTIGYVVDTNDPQQMGRVRAVCGALGDTYEGDIEMLPWCSYGAPFGGHLSVGSRGPETDESTGRVAYGSWFIPKPGAQVLVVCIDGDSMDRVWIGCLYDTHTPHTMPHGRWKYEDHPDLEKGASDARPFGPYTGAEKFIEPLNKNMEEHFTAKPEPNFERRTRAADHTVAAIGIEDLPRVYSKVQDDKDYVWDDFVSRQGYQVNRADPSNRPLTGLNYDSMVYSITSPAFHAMSMDDRQMNSRMRFRTSSGHQIIMDDTNERIYISTAGGKNWIEIDQDGDITMYTDRRVSVHAKKDINFTSDQTIRLQAVEGIHMYTNGEIRMQAVGDVHMRFQQNLRMNVAATTYLESGQNINFKVGDSMFLQAASDINVNAGSQLKLTSGSTTHINGGGQILETAGVIHFNGPTAATAEDASPPEEEPAKWTNKVPDHEPWARVMTKDDFTHEPEFPYDSKEVGRVERGEPLPRGTYWRR